MIEQVIVGIEVVVIVVRLFLKVVMIVVAPLLLGMMTEDHLINIIGIHLVFEACQKKDLI